MFFIKGTEGTYSPFPNFILYLLFEKEQEINRNYNKTNSNNNCINGAECFNAGHIFIVVHSQCLKSRLQ
jgi:hypothetical protein